MLVLGIERGSDVGLGNIRLLCDVMGFIVGGNDGAVGVDVREGRG